jgi:signal transduction histidine kinase
LWSGLDFAILSQRTTQLLSRVEFVLATIVIVVGLTFWTWADFADARRDAEAKVSNAALAIDEFTSRSLLAIDVVLESVVARLAEDGLDKLGSEPESERLRRIASRLPETGGLFIADDVGTVVFGTMSYPSGANVSDREWFNILQQGKAELYVGGALKGRGVHNLFFPVARSIRRPNRAFIGVAQVGLEATYVANLFRGLDVGSGAHLGLYRTRDGAVVARYPMTEALLDETIASLPYFEGFAKSQAQSWIGWSRDRGQEQLVSARRLERWPLIVSASLPKHAVYSGAWSRLLWRSIIAAIAIATFLLLTALALRQARREATALRETQSELARVARLTTMGEMAASIAHEIRQPLAAIIWHAGAGLLWLKNKTPDLGQVQLDLDSIVSEGHRTDQVIKNIQAMFRNESTSRIQVDANEIIQQVIALTMHNINSSGIGLATNFATKPPPLVWADPAQLQQVVQNLIMNAVEAMDSTAERFCELRLTTEIDRADVLITIADTGPGIDPKTAESIFKPFFTTKPGGMGMGLSICKSITEAHGGRLTASLGERGGTVFRIFLPHADTNAMESSQ